MDLIGISSAFSMEKLEEEAADILEALVVLLKGTGFMSLLLQGTVFQALWMLSVPGSICWRTTMMLQGQFSGFVQTYERILKSTHMIRA